MPIYEFSENNSGGSWWLNRAQYDKLFDAGFFLDEDGMKSSERFGSSSLSTKDVPYGWRSNVQVEAASLQEAVERWEDATGEDFFAEGCNCCGAPFSMHSVGEGDYDYVSGDSVNRTVNRPW